MFKENSLVFKGGNIADREIILLRVWPVFAVLVSPRPDYRCERTSTPRATSVQNYRWLTYLILPLLLLFSNAIFSQTEMSGSEVDALKAMVRQQADTVKTITSNFVQFKHLDFLSDDIESKGKLAFMAPNRVKWEYVEPFSYSLIFKEGSLYIDDNGNKSNMDLGGNKIFTQLNELITASIQGNLFDSDQFDVSYFKNANDHLVEFTPKDAQFAEFIKAFHLTFNPAGEVIEVKMIEPSDDYTQIIFSDRKTNQPLSDADFAQ